MKVEVHCLHLFIDAESEVTLIDYLEEAIKDIKNGIGDCSSHPCDVEPYLPHVHWSVQTRKYEVDQEWINFVEKWQSDIKWKMEN